jgi:limonene-1,2-epoxide hydrolase
VSNTETPIDLVRRFCEQVSNLDLDAFGDFFAADAVYHNIPVDPVTGVENIKETIAGFTTGVEKLEFVVHHIAAEGPVVLTERTDIFVLPHVTIELPVMGTFEVHDGKITAWRDYFDLNQFMSKLTG